MDETTRDTKATTSGTPEGSPAAPIPTPAGPAPAGSAATPPPHVPPPPGAPQPAAPQGGPVAPQGGTGWSSPHAPGTPGAVQRDPWAASHHSPAGASATPADGSPAPGADGPRPPYTGETPTTVFGTPSGPGGPAGSAEQPVAPKPRRGRMLLAGLAIGAILGGGAGAAVTTVIGDDSDTATPVRSSLDDSSEPDGAGDQGDGQNQQASTAGDVQTVAAEVLPSVVSISVRSQMGEAGGTGVIISSDGEILTNNHVVGGSEGAQVQVTFQDGTTADAEVLGTDPLTDLAVIKAVDVSGLTPAELGVSGDIAVGEQVVAIGSPLGLEGTVTTGIVSALNRPVAAGGDQGGATSVIDALQTDAPINPGNSGGPLVNMSGQVIGINSAIATTGSNSGSIGLGFSIPIDQAKPIAEELIETGQATHAQIGVSVGTPTDGTRGAYIASVEPGSSADDAGLAEGDIVTKVDERLITDGTSLVAAARSHRPGDVITVTYLRDGKEATTEVTLGSDAQTT